MAGQSGDNASELIDNDVLASSVPPPVKKDVTVEAAAVDTDSGSVLEPGLVLVPLTSGGNAGKYTNFDSGGTDGEEVGTEAVVLAHRIDVSDGNDAPATVFVEAVVKRDKVRAHSGFSWSDQPNLTRWPQT